MYEDENANLILSSCFPEFREMMRSRTARGDDGFLTNVLKKSLSGRG